MPRKDPVERLAYQRQWYAANSARVIAKVAKRKRTLYAGICKNCGGPTTGQSKNKASRYCAKPECKRALWEEKNGRTSKQGSK